MVMGFTKGGRIFCASGSTFMPRPGLLGMSTKPFTGSGTASTTSLPERLGGERNWDYRFCWLRDATFTLLALMNAGFYDEARAWREWLLRAAAGAPDQLQIIYGLAGERRLTTRGSSGPTPPGSVRTTRRHGSRSGRHP